MQKFVIIKRSQKQSVDIIETQVRMSGYLKKKRNRVGGWRKLWFVLQNQLLLAYSSREDYEKKLVPFKDVLNLVPGSVVRPASGSRFTIETPSNTMYTYRCADSKTCAEWIMALLESLSLKTSQSVIDKNMGFMMTSQNLFKVPSRSCESLSKPLFRPTPKLVRLPISKSSSTKRLIERGCIDDSNYIKLKDDQKPTLQQIINQSTREQLPLRNPTSENHKSRNSENTGKQNFRLHENALNKNQSKEVSRINRMFDMNSVTNSSVGSNCSSNNSTAGDGRIDGEHEQLAFNSDVNQNRMIDGQIYSNIEEQTQQLTLGDETEVDRSLSDDEYFDERRRLRPFSRRVDGSHTTEAIYAVVDLKDKHQRRAMLKEIESKDGRERPKSCHIISTSDYEEVNSIIPNKLSPESENIYEPINIAEQLPSNRNPVWKYFPKINFDSLMEFARIGHQKTHLPKELPETSETGTSFADMKRKIGNHRRSIKDKMKKFYTRNDRLKPTVDQSDLEKETILSQQPISQPSTRSKREKNIFGSLPRMRKSRTSACLDDDEAPKNYNLPRKGNSEFHIGIVHDDVGVLKCDKTTDL